MANEEQLAILRQGVEVWNGWRAKKPTDLNIDLIGANLAKINLSGAYLLKADLSGAILAEANLSGAFLNEANLSGADLTRANLCRTDLRTAFLDKSDLREADLKGARLEHVKFREANLSEADLSEAELRGASLFRANFSKSLLSGCSFSNASVKDTLFGSVDLSTAVALEDILHYGPSTIGIDTVAKSKGKIPEIFLRGCGLSDWEIEQVKLYNPELNNDEITQIQYRVYELRASQALQISPLFISYSHADSEFVDKVGNHLNEKGVRHWRDIHEMKAGRMEKQIDLAISQNPTVLLVLSQYSIKSDWVEHEVRTARELEKEIGRDVLCPIALDDSWKDSRWPKRVMEQIMEYSILDFSAWEDDVKFEGMFRKLIDGLELFYKG